MKKTILLRSHAVPTGKNKGLVISRVLLPLLFFFFAFPATIFAQQKTVTGRVTSDKGQGLQASVTIKGTGGGTSTDANGNYSTTASASTVLIFSAVGHVSKEIRVGNNTIINAVLASNDVAMNEVVVIGYGTQRKRDVTGAVVSVTEKALREVPVANLQQALQGRAAGLEIQTVGNRPGAGAQIRIRGNRSISGSNEPLFVVDGIPYDGTLNDINPDEVASVDVLKDASATAIYGSRGANGVILITTKKGRNGETRISYNGYYGIGTPQYEYPVFNAEEYQAMRNLSPWNGGYMAEELKGKAQNRNTDWQDLMYDNALRMDHNLNIAGGSGGTTFSFGGGYYKETSLMPGEEYNRYSLKATIDTRVGSRIRVGITTQNTLSVELGSQFVSGSAMFRTVALSPLMPGYDSTGAVYLLPNGDVDDNNGDGRYSPLLLKGKETWVDRVRRLRTFNTMYGEIEIIKGLKYRINAGYSFAQQNGGQFKGSDQLPGNPSFFRPGVGNTARVDNGETWGYTVDNLIYYDKVIAKDHKINFTALYGIQESQSVSNYVQKDSITEDFVQFYNMGAASPTPVAATAGTESKSALISYMARVNYSFKDRYLLTATYRRDGSSRLAPGNQWYDYPAVSAGWVITDESFMKNIKPLSLLKLRVGWGKTSNQAINPYDSKGLVNNSNGLYNSASPGTIGAAGGFIRYNYGSTIVNGYNVVTLPNPDLSWEFTKTTNIGLDFALFNNRITGSMEYYNSKTDKILYSVNLPVTSGVAGAFTTNVGKMENKGFEFSASSLNYKSRSGFTWSTDLNFFFNKNKLLQLSSNVKEDVGSQLFVGYSMTAIYDYVNDGVWQLNEAAQAAALGSVPGQIKLRDISGPNGVPDGVINATYDRKVIGDMDANFQGGITNRFSYKGFDLSAVIHARLGGLLVSQLHSPLASYLTIMDGKRNGLKVDYWTPTNPSNWFPMPQTTISSVTDAGRTLAYYDASFVRLRSINLGYTFSDKIMSRLKAQSLRVYFTIDNVALLYSPYYKKTGIDPQATAAGDRGVGGNLSNIRENGRGNGALVVGLATPPRRTFTFGLNVTL
jgi:TonB-linked SusC/RagA family outer membrane protein